LYADVPEWPNGTGLGALFCVLTFFGRLGYRRKNKAAKPVGLVPPQVRILPSAFFFLSTRKGDLSEFFGKKEAKTKFWFSIKQW